MSERNPELLAMLQGEWAGGEGFADLEETLLEGGEFFEDAADGVDASEGADAAFSFA